jgi:hypothetical protein
VPPIRGFFLLGGGSYFISPVVSPFFLTVTRNSAPNVSPPFRLNFEVFSFLNALKLDRLSVTPRSLPFMKVRFGLSSHCLILCRVPLVRLSNIVTWMSWVMMLSTK